MILLGTFLYIFFYLICDLNSGLGAQDRAGYVHTPPLGRRHQQGTIHINHVNAHEKNLSHNHAAANIITIKWLRQEKASKCLDERVLYDKYGKMMSCVL